MQIATGQLKTFLPAGHDATYVASGHLVYGSVAPSLETGMRRGSLRAVRFDPVRVETIGDSLNLLDFVRLGDVSPVLNYTLSTQGDLAFVDVDVSPASPPARGPVWA